ncbi:hypothetical protein AB4114_11345 [Paenibacillus sp. 2RAB27]|uniref:hypothetical protein n=1 Tax=Paenibacillus sp. 2RAB27 TaxID=3232991 RepID=UPI003F982E4E
MSEIVTIQDPQEWIPANVSDGQLYVKVNQAVGVVKLSNLDGHLMQLDNGDWGISAEGYRACNVVAGIPTITPDTMKLPDGREVCNPYIELDPATGTADKFWSHKITVGKSALGGLVVSSATVLLDIRVRFARELMQKIESNRDAGKLCMSESLSDEEKRSGIFIPFQGSIGVYGRHDCTDTIRVIQNLISNKEHGDKIVQTLAWKSSIKQQPSMPPSKIRVVNGSASVLVVGYKLDMSLNELEAISKEYKETGLVEGAEVLETVSTTSEDSHENAEFSLLSTEGGTRF